MRLYPYAHVDISPDTLAKHLNVSRCYISLTPQRYVGRNGVCFNGPCGSLDSGSDCISIYALGEIATEDPDWFFRLIEAFDGYYITDTICGERRALRLYKPEILWWAEDQDPDDRIDDYQVPTVRLYSHQLNNSIRGREDHDQFANAQDASRA